METADGGEVAPGPPQSTHINVHIHQEPVLSLSSLLRPPTPDTTPQTPGSRGLRLRVVSWVVQIAMGLLSGVLGGFGCILFYQDYRYLQLTWEAGIWTGVVAVLAGVVVFIHEKRGGICWGLLRTLLALAAFATAIAAICTGAYYFTDIRYSLNDQLCEGRPSWEPILTPSTPEEASKLHLCLLHLHMFMVLVTGLQAMLLSVWVLLLLVSLVPLFLYCWRKLQPEEKRDQKTLLGVNETQPCLS